MCRIRLRHSVNGVEPHATCRLCAQVRQIEGLLQDRGTSVPDSVRVIVRGALVEVRRLLEREPGHYYLYDPR